MSLRSIDQRNEEADDLGILVGHVEIVDRDRAAIGFEVRVHPDREVGARRRRCAVAFVGAGERAPRFGGRLFKRLGETAEEAGQRVVLRAKVEAHPRLVEFVEELRERDGLSIARGRRDDNDGMLGRIRNAFHNARSRDRLKGPAGFDATVGTDGTDHSLTLPYH